MGNLEKAAFDLAQKNNTKIGDLSTNKADKGYVEEQLTSKRDVNTKISQVDCTPELLSQIAGTASINSVPQDLSVTPDKLASNLKTELYSVSTKNLLNPNKLESGYIDSLNVFNSSASLFHTEKIAVTQGETVFFTNDGVDVQARFVTALKADGTPIATTSSQITYVVNYAIPTDVTHVIISYNPTTYPKFAIAKGTPLRTYEPYYISKVKTLDDTINSINYLKKGFSDTPIKYNALNFVNPTYELGTFSGVNGSPSVSSTRIRTKDFITGNNNMIIHLQNNSYMFNIYKFNASNVFVSSTGFIASEYKLSDGYTYKITVKKIDDSTMTINEETTNAIKITDGIIAEKVDFSALDYSVTPLKYNALNFKDISYESGAILGTNGGLSSSTTRIRTASFLTSADASSFNLINPGYMFNIYRYNESEVFIDSTGFIAGSYTLQNGYKYKFTVKKVDDSTLTVNEDSMNAIKVAEGFVYNNNEQGVLDLYLPPYIYIAKGVTIELYNNQVCLQSEKYHIRWVCSVGKALKRKFSITGTTDLIGDYTLTIEVIDDELNVIGKASTTLKVVDNVITNTVNLCPIGDSLSSNKDWQPELDSLSGGKINLVGTRVLSNGYYHEGRAGFSAQNYITGSPYDYNGAGETPNHKLFNPTTNRFDWNYYKTTYGINPNIVQIWLGTNGITLSPTNNVTNIKQMIDYIRQDDPNIPIYIVNTIYRGNQNGIGVQQSTDGYASFSGSYKYEEDKEVFNLMKALNEAISAYSNLYIIPLALTHDSEYNYGAIEKPVNPRAVQTELMPYESIHPDTQGFLQIADYLYSTYCGTLA